MNVKKRLIISSVIIVMLTAASYLTEVIVTRQGISSAKIIKITEKDKVVAYVSAEILKQLVEQNHQQDEMYSGPSLLLTLNAAGAGRFQQIEVKGQNDSVILNKKDIKDDLEIFLAGNGTMNLCREGNTSDSIVKEITEISIKN